MKLLLRFSLILIPVVLLTCKAEEDFPVTLVADEGEEPEPIVAPCSYNDSAEVEDETGMNGKITGEWREHFDYDELIFRFYWSSNDLIIKYNKQRGFENIESRIVDFASTSYSDISMYIVFRDGSSRSMEIVSGKLYIVVQDDGNVKFDWCDVTFYDEEYDWYRSSHGGYLLEF